MNEDKICKNPLCILNYNLVMRINEFFAENPKKKIDVQGFMDLQLLI